MIAHLDTFGQLIRLFCALSAIFFISLSIQYQPLAAEMDKGGEAGANTAQSVGPGRLDAESAGRILDFYNNAWQIFTDGYYSLAGKLLANAKHYLSNWEMPSRLKISGRKEAAANLVPPKGLFDDAEANALAQALTDMDKALDRLLDNYSDLKNYGVVEAINDNGAFGNQLRERMELANSSFIRARKSWLNIVERRAAEAEATFLHDHPLRRQILAGQEILANIRQIGRLTAAEAATPDILNDLRANINALIANAARPPFPAAPGQERLYRSFLKHAENYSILLKRCSGKGVEGALRRELRDSASQCANSYNEFAESVNLRAGGMH